ARKRIRASRGRPRPARRRRPRRRRGFARSAGAAGSLHSRLGRSRNGALARRLRSRGVRVISGRLHRLLVTGMAASALIAFLAGAGAEAPSAWAALPLLVWAALRSPSERLASRIELAFR